jgi:hypothetical protein
LRLFAPQVARAAAVPHVPFVVLILIATSTQFDPVPLAPAQPAVTVSVVETPREPFAVTVKLLPIWPAPETVDWVGGADTATMKRPVVQPLQERAWPTTKGLACALKPPVNVIVWPEMVPLADAA